MFDAYWQFLSPFDWVILCYGALLFLVQSAALFMRCFSYSTFFVQNLGRTQSACLQWTELLPVLGLMGTVMAMLNTFAAFDASSEEGVNIVVVIQRFAPAMTTTLSGLFMVALNLPLNQLLFMLTPKKND